MQRCPQFVRAVRAFLSLQARQVHFRCAAEIVPALLFTAKAPAFAAFLDGKVFPLTRFACRRFGFHRYV